MGVTVRDLILMLVAVFGTVAYCLSFTLLDLGGSVREIAYQLGWAAGISWIGLGCVLVMISGMGPRMWSWFRTCLNTMAVGMAILSLSTAMNLFMFAAGVSAANVVAVHVVVLVVSDVSMGVFFVGRVRGSAGIVYRRKGVPQLLESARTEVRGSLHREGKRLSGLDVGVLGASLLWVVVLNGLFGFTLVCQRYLGCGTWCWVQ